jgi:hypothetical protein
MIPTQTIGASFGTYGASTVVGWGGKNVVEKCWWGYIYTYIYIYIYSQKQRLPEIVMIDKCFYPKL